MSGPNLNSRGRRRLLVGTGNPGKLREYAQLLRDAPFELVSLADLGITHDVEETGATFADNAWLKASEYAAISGMLTLADDSGLEVDALDGEPGVKSARYGPALDEPGACRSDADRVALLLHNLAGVPWEKRTARFRCVIAVADPGGRNADVPRLLASVVGSVAGMIQYTPEGEGGFGYDPVFYLPSFGKTVAQLSLADKNRISHRGSAAARAVQVLEQLRPASAKTPERARSTN